LQLKSESYPQIIFLINNIFTGLSTTQ